VTVPYTQAVFSGTSGAITTTVGTATTYTGLVLTNPINSPVQLVLEAAFVAPIVAQTAAIQVGLMAGFSSTTAVTQTTAATVVSNFIGGAVGSGLLAKAATLSATPAILLVNGSLLTGAITTSTLVNGLIDLNDGQPLIIIPPGGFLAFYTSAASVASSVVFSFQWGEQ
jgi:hypothetical protein